MCRTDCTDKCVSYLYPSLGYKTCRLCLQALRLFLVWDSEGIAETEDKILEEIFESVDADDGDNDSDDDDDSGSSGDDRKKPKRGVKVEKKNKKRKKSKSSDDESVASVDSSDSQASLGGLNILEHSSRKHCWILTEKINHMMTTMSKIMASLFQKHY